MDDHTKKRPAGGPELSKRSYGLYFREPKRDERNFHDCNRTGWITGHNSLKSPQNNSSEKLKYLKPPLNFRSVNPNAASSSRSFSSSSNLNISFHESKIGDSLEADVSECSNRRCEDEDGLNFDLEFHGRKMVTDYSRGLKPPILHTFPSSSTKMMSNSNATFASRYGKQISQSSVSTTQDNANPPFRQCLIPRIPSQLPKSDPHAIGRSHRYGLKNLGCASISDALPSSSSSDGLNQRAVSLRKKFHDGEGSSSGIASFQVQGGPDDTSRMTKSQYNNRNATVSVRPCSSSGGESSKIRWNDQEDVHNFELPGPFMYPMRTHAPLVISEVAQARSPLPFEFQNTSYAVRPRSNSQSSRHRSVMYSEDVGDYIRSNMEGTAGVLQALERIEQDEELTYEQLMVLEANLLEGFSFYDQHRDMRLDIDNMSYEDLLALEEKMGSVSTALPEEALSKCLKKSTYRTNFLRMPGLSGHGDDDFKCSICQEEYMIGEELGSLPCKHHYHVTCIQQWLRLKNWCPICKAPATSLNDQQP
ncbi:E3 ubiquitin-protein ligase MBR2 [Dendrobium catenatum]|uniref:E3 ubiquitin-protein ligase MBR2 n=1 Tax=Dendrobium catenatum TaxID=906689 RepID=UPI0009F71945|nr:E3 ubiquitin-protein ligase MBR2 [Dendrobium catenatum]XP_020673469.1 E3 ubiquitin-protein ligase MBR2 [Dendrobium catenatum]XP_020673471.1 E3 ubiquitin-protein ligase MBR2 [Dendrobium catenatum]XP_020673473.1 E3 ubiquitin-protein ligase MBR2 [Dendrobium catenatum]XP_020673474.1 E3 ubiquitin-protein ligase MBR2 [Dendrobium catenatum]XP_028550955.1 E3 ubiquitin-protein ligase MBR2 [Dendrobium catenatum]XP_028550956.1 E3 ubiquitin-protein ligase MBR2 [Dendrobium catenatum]XP_028550957.1 E3 